MSELARMNAISNQVRDAAHGMLLAVENGSVETAAIFAGQATGHLNRLIATGKRELATFAEIAGKAHGDVIESDPFQEPAPEKPAAKKGGKK
jgi:hypothetical protein